MNNDLRIKDKKEFNNILQIGKRIYNENCIIYYVNKTKDNSRFGITQVKKYGKAYQRNKIHRLTREIIRKNKNSFKNTYDYIIIMKKSCINIKYDQLEKSILNLIKERL